MNKSILAALIGLVMVMGLAEVVHADGGASNVGIASFYRLSDLSQALQMTASGVYRFKADFLKSLAQSIDSGPAIGGITMDDPGIAARAFVLNTLDPLFKNTHSTWFEGRILNQYELSLANQNHKLHLMGMSSIPKRPEVIHIALEELKSGWMGLRPFLTTEDDRAHCEAIVGSIGRAMATGDLKDLQLSIGDSMLDNLSGQTRTEGLAVLVKSISLYLQ